MKQQPENIIIAKALEEVQKVFNKDVSDLYTYHNYEHTMRVYRAMEMMTDLANLESAEREVLLLASLFHDLGFVKGPVGHEKRSAALARKWLSDRDYPEEKIVIIERLILATQKAVVPKDNLEQCIKDADLSGLASKYYFEDSEKLRDEWQNISGQVMEDIDWHLMNKDFFKDHNYYTEAAKILYDAPKKINYKILNKKIKDLEDREITISSNKSAQTQFKTALRNHIDLSAIADNKANIMLSVNALIITVGMPVIASRIVENRMLLIPILILLIVCIISMVFATLATRPIKMKGKITMEDLAAQKSNLFFFGNFFKMDYEKYEEGIRYILQDPNRLDSSITRDLFYLGKSLGTKFTYLRLCYNVFMYGIVLSVLAFCIVFLLL